MEIIITKREVIVAIAKYIKEDIFGESINDKETLKCNTFELHEDRIVIISKKGT